MPIYLIILLTAVISSTVTFIVMSMMFVSAEISRKEERNEVERIL